MTDTTTLLNEEESRIRKEIMRIQKDTSLTGRQRQDLIFTLFNKKKEQHCGSSCSSTTSTTSCCSTTSRDKIKDLITNLPLTSSGLSSSDTQRKIHIPCSQIYRPTADGTSSENRRDCDHYVRG